MINNKIKNSEQGDQDVAQEIIAFRIYTLNLMENPCQTNVAKERRGKDFNTFFMNEIKLYFVYMSLWHNQNILHYLKPSNCSYIKY